VTFIARKNMDKEHDYIENIIEIKNALLKEMHI
jgi:hypothetical protein